MSPTACPLLRRRLGLLVLTLVGSQTLAGRAVAELSGIATFASQYIYRGQTISDGEPALQLGLDYEYDSGVFGGAWASTIDLQSQFGERDFELDYYLGYQYAPQPSILLALTLLRYTYPGQTGSLRYDHNEALISATWNERFSLELGYTNDLYGRGRTARHWELRSEWPVAAAWVISAALGGNDLTDIGASHYLHWDFGASARFAWLTLDVRWYDNQEPGGFPASWSADSQLVLSLSAGF